MPQPPFSSTRFSFRHLMPLLRPAGGALLLGACLFATSCVMHQPPPPPPPMVKTHQPFRMYDWRGDGVPGLPSIVIYLDEQKAHFYRDNREVGWTYVATGKPSHPTPVGNFRIIEKTKDKVSNLYGVLKDADGNVTNSDFNTSKDELPEGMQFDPARMPLYMRLTNDGVGMHAGRIPKPGHTASHGCIRLPKAMAEKFFANAKVGTPVTILAHSPNPQRPGKFGW